MTGETIKSMREARGLTLKDLAQLIPGMTAGRLSAIENGANTSLKTLHRIAAALGMKLTVTMEDK